MLPISRATSLRELYSHTVYAEKSGLCLVDLETEMCMEGRCLNHRSPRSNDANRNFGQTYKSEGETYLLHLNMNVQMIFFKYVAIMDYPSIQKVSGSTTSISPNLKISIIYNYVKTDSCEHDNKPSSSIK